MLAPSPGAPTIGIGRTNPINNWTNEVGFASLRPWTPKRERLFGHTISLM